MDASLKNEHASRVDPQSSREDTVIVGQYEALGQTAESPSWMPSYRGLPIHSLPELHERAAELLASVLPRASSVLDLAAGAGALTLRLTDLGYHVSACDFVSENFRLHGKNTFFQINLNEKFAGALPSGFDAIVASEILEHIENPRHVIRQCAALLRPGGWLIATTPNIESSFSIATRLRSGQFSLFDDDYYRRDGHITPITSTMLRQALTEAGFVIDQMETNGGFSPTPWWKMRLLIGLIDRLRVDRQFSRGSSLVVLARKT